MKVYIVAILFLFFNLQTHAQRQSPYQTDFWKDGAWLTAGFGLSAYGLILIQNKDDFTQEKLDALSKDDIWAIDRWAAGNNSESASKISDIPFYTSFATPFLLLINEKSRNNAGQLSVIFLESMSTTAALFSISAGLIERSRPKVYDTNLEQSERLAADNQRSFYSGHVAASATATFFAAQVFSDFFPDSKAKPYIWAAAAVIPATVGFYRIKSGNHFLSDTILGYAIGAGAGIFIPRLHKLKENNLQVSPGLGYRSQTINISYTF